MSRLHPCGERDCHECRPCPMQHLIRDVVALLQRRPDLNGMPLPTALDPRSNA